MALCPYKEVAKLFQQFGFIELLIVAGFVILLISFFILISMAGSLKKTNVKFSAGQNTNMILKTEKAAISAVGVKSATNNDNALIAVLTAAVAAYMGTSPNGLNIKSYRRLKKEKPSWRQAGRIEDLNNRY
jgi:hypothetical protein